MTTFTFALAPTLAGTRLERPEFQEPLRAYLERCLDVPVRLVILPSYSETFDALRAAEVDAASVGDLASQRGQEEGGIESLVSTIDARNEVSTYRCAIVTRHDSGIQSIDRLAGCTLGLVDGQSTSGYHVPRAMLREAHIDPDADVTIRLYPSHQDVVEAVITGEVDAGATHERRLTPPSLERGPDYARLRVVARSRDIPRGPVVVRKSLDPAMRASLSDALMHIHERDADAARVLLEQGHRYMTAGRRSNPTLKSIAALAGVSYATVSRVINDSGYVAPETRARVQAIVDEVGYAPNGNARVLLGRQFPLVGIAVDLTDAELLATIQRLRPAFEAADMPLVLCPIDASLDGSLYPGILRDRRLGALIVPPSLTDDSAVTHLARTGQIVILLGAASEDLPAGLMTASESELVDVLRRVLRTDGPIPSASAG